MPSRSRRSMKVSGPKSRRRAHQPISVTRSPTFSLRSAPHECVRSRFPRFSIIKNVLWSLYFGLRSRATETDYFLKRTKYKAQKTKHNCDRINSEEHRPSVYINRLTINAAPFIRSNTK